MEGGGKQQTESQAQLSQRERNIMLAYKKTGMMLTPDHCIMSHVGNM